MSKLRLVQRLIVVLAMMIGIAHAPLRAQSGALRVEHVLSRAIGQNLIGESSQIEVAVYTPPGYSNSGHDYPVLYLLHGIAGTYRDWTNGSYQGLRIHVELDSLITAGAIPPMIVVMPTASNRYMGSYYANSPVTGNWSDFVARELVAWTDSAFRTRASREGRGIAGHSMGGFGALTLAMDHPGVFSAVFAMSPCCLKLTDDLGPANAGWARALGFQAPEEIITALQRGEFYPVAILGILSVATPNTGRPPLFVDYPFRLDGAGFLLQAEPTYSTYREFFPIERLDERAEGLRELRGLALDVGQNDQFPHIPPGTAAFSRRLSELGIPHVFELYDGDHRNRLRQRLASKMLPFFARHLSANDR